MNSNEFADANPELAPYIDQIRDVSKKQPLTSSSFSWQLRQRLIVLHCIATSQGRRTADVALQDIFKLRTALDAEFKADNPLVGSKDFGVGNQLLDVSINDVNAIIEFQASR
jgi:hypothetical protein